MSKFLEKLEDFLPHLLYAIIIFAVGYFVTKLVLKLMSKATKLQRLDTTIMKFLTSITHVLMLTIVTVMSLSAINVPMSSIITTLGAAGLAIGLALQNSLSNVAGGFIILFSKPFKCGDYIKVEGDEGTVESISILYTRLLTLDNTSINIPNGNVAKSTVINYTSEEKRRLELKFSISYHNDHHKAIEIIKKVIADQPQILNTPDEPLIKLWEHGSNAIVILTRVWIPTKDYWDIRSEILERVKEEFDKNGISIPYKQVDIHLEKGNAQ